MKKILFLSSALLITAMTLFTTGYAQSGLATYKVSNPVVVASGSYNQPASYVPLNPAGVTQIFPWYTKLDTVNNTGVDTFHEKISGPHEHVYTWCHVNGITGTNTSCVMKLYVSGDSSGGVDWGAPVYTASVTATNPVASYLFTGWPYTAMRWTFTGSGTQQSSWVSGLIVRYKATVDELYDNRRRRIEDVDLN